MNKEKIIAAGVDYEQGLSRFAGKAEIYEKYLGKFFENTLMDELKEHLEAKDYPAAFRTAHDLKGTSGNLSINQLFKKIDELVELLRSGNPSSDPMPLYEQARALYESAEKAVKE